MTVSNYKELAKMVSKQKLKMSPEVEHVSATKDASESFQSKQKMLESRIEKLRSLESKI
jgi:hypothetical protein